MQDINGNILQEKDMILMPTGFGQMTVGQIEAVSSGLVNPNNPNAPAQPTAVIVFRMPLAIAPNGLLLGVVKLNLPKEQE